MKARLLLTFIALFSTKFLFAQDSLIGATKHSADSIMDANQSKFSSAIKTTDTNLPINTFQNKDGSITLLYYDKDSICYESAVLYKTTNIDAVKNILKKQFNQQDEKLWIRKDNQIKAELLILNGMVVIKYLKI